jgi:sigma-B regulation protein RsbU (phosphoserine phosphatase)
MIAGRSGMVETIVDGAPAFIFYRPVERTGWSIAIVCPESDVFARYNRLLIITWLIIAIGLILLMLFCYQIVRRAVQPLRQLDEQAKRIAEGHFDEPLSQSSRHDSVGRLQNSFILMQKSLAQMVNDIRIANDELEQHNEELTHAYQLKLQTNRRKSAFIRDMYHQIRTPLNIIAGFAQVLAASLHGLSAEEVSDITSRMKESANDISRLSRQLDEITTDNPTNKE